MSDIILDNIYLILLLPFWIFLIIMLGRFFSVYVNKIVIYGLTLFASFLGTLLCTGGILYLPYGKILETEFPFIKINHFIISAGLHVDKTALIFGLVLFLVSFLVQLFSISYMKNEKKNYRFYALLNLFNFSMAGLLFSPNLFQMYVFWELVGVVSYLLIGFDYSSPLKSIASKKVFIINRIGDTALISGILLSSYFIYTYSENFSLTTLSFVDMNIISTLIYAYTSTPLFWLICGLFIVAALVKSAQFPFYTWLIDAMRAKLPVSALLHSATMVASGVYLIIRLDPFLTLEPILLKLIAGVGILTALICSVFAIFQSNPKKVLAYSTSAQLGLMFLALGVGNIKAAFVFFIAHAFIKTMLFLMLPKSYEKFSLIGFVGFLLAGLSLSGLMFSGMIAKELIFAGLGNDSSIVFCLISFLTAFYIIKIALVIGFDKENKTPKLEAFVFIVLFLINILFYLYLRKHFEYKIAEPFWAALAAWICVYILYIKNAFFNIKMFHYGLYLDRFYTTVIVWLYDSLTKFCALIDEKVFANYRPIVGLAGKGVRTFAFIEDKVVDGAVEGVKNLSKSISEIDLKAQSGNIQRYNAYAFIIITIILASLIIAYTAVINYIGG